MEKDNLVLITIEEFERNYTIGYTEAKIEHKGKFGYIPWGYIYWFLGKYYPNIEVRFFEDDVLSESKDLAQLPVSGNSTNGFSVHPYLYDRNTGLSTPKFFYPITDFSNKPILGDKLNSYHLNTSRMRAIAKVVAINLGLGLHLHMGLEDILDKDEEAKLNKEESDQKQNVINKIQKIEGYIKNQFASYVDDSYEEITNNKLEQKTLVQLNKLSNLKEHYLYTLKLKKALHEYEQKMGEKHEYEEKLKDIEQKSATEVNNHAKKVQEQLKG